MKQVPVRHALEYLAYLPFTRAVERLPAAAAREIGSRLGRLWARVDRRHRGLAEANLAAVMPDLDATARRRIAVASFGNLGGAFFELLPVARWSAERVRERFEVEGWERLEAARSVGRGVLLIAGHYGSWQLAAYPNSLLLGGIHLVVRPTDNPWVASDLRRVRERFGSAEISRGGSAHRLLGLLRGGGVVGLVIDQRPPPLTGVIVPFLGRPARSAPVPAFASLRSGAPAVPVTCVTTGRARYRLLVGEPIWPEGDGDAAVAGLTERYFEALGREILDRPERWMWMHDRWGLLPEERAAWESGASSLSPAERASLRRQRGWS